MVFFDWMNFSDLQGTAVRDRTARRSRPTSRRNGPALTSARLVPTERKSNVDDGWFRDGKGRGILESNRRGELLPAAADPARGVGLMRVRTIAGGVEVLAPAKLNLFLEILGRRPDGYHDIETVMAATNLHDTLTIQDDPSGEIRLRCSDPALPVGADNLVIKAADRLREATGCRLGAKIDLVKAIPAQAGLGGGSSDAAATLAALDRLWDLRMAPEQLDALAAEVGSDVPFFNHAPAAICRGRGERVEPVPLTATYHCVLICPPVGVSTADVYRRVIAPDRPREPGPVLDALRSGEPGDLGRSLFNRLQTVAEAMRPELSRVRDALANLGPLLDGSAMSGSGSAYFGLCRDQAAAEHAAEILQLLGLGWVRVVTCGP
jgi:4-diphosphocytidyl-2-C-methyl-D-erythritol kinase